MLTLKIKKSLFCGVILLCLSECLSAQVQIFNTASCVIPGTGINYPYTISGLTPSTSDHWCITGGIIAGTSTNCQNSTGSPSISVTWNAGITTGIVAYYKFPATTPTATLTVNVAINTISPQFSPYNYPFVPSGVDVSVAFIGNDESSVCGFAGYNWLMSTDGVNYSNIPNANQKDLVIDAVFTTTVSYERMMMVSSGSMTSAPFEVLPSTALTMGTITPAVITISPGGTVPASTFSATATSGGTSCGPQGGAQNYAYLWETSTDNINWTVASSGSGNGASTFSPVGPINSETFVRQVIECGPNVGVTNTVIVNFFPALDPGVIGPLSRFVALGAGTGNLTGNAASGGDPSQGYTYTWWSSTDNMNWTNVGGGGLSFTASNLSSPNNYYKREVTNGAKGSAYSNTVLVQTVGGALPGYSNYVRTRVLLASNITTSAAADVLTDLNAVHQSTDYFDGLGRPVQTVDMQGSLVTGSSPTDLVVPWEYDAVGREPMKFLPYASTDNNGSYKTDPMAAQTSFNATLFAGENYYYNLINYEASDLNRIKSTSAPGNSWTGSNRRQLNADEGNVVTDEVRIWNVVNSGTAGVFGSYSTSGVYPVGSLAKTLTTDEQGHQVIEFKDLDGKVILKKVQNTASIDDGSGTGYTGWLCTYYIYDDMGLLRCVVQPHGVELLVQNAWSFSALSNVILNEQCFRYEYDQRNRMVMKKVPGVTEVYMVYDMLDRLVMTQDAVMRSQGQRWLVTMYENSLDRPVQTGIVANSSIGNLSFAQHITAASSSAAYPSSTPPTGWELLTMTHYDDYSNVPVGNGSLNTTVITMMSNFYSTFNASPQYAQPMTQSTPSSAISTKGLVTWTKVEAMDGLRTNYIYAANIYDTRARMIQQQKQNYSGGLDYTTIQYDFSGKPLVSDMRHQFNPQAPATTQTYEIATRNTYDQLARPVKVEKMIVASMSVPALPQTWKTISTMAYDAIGRLSTKTVGTVSAGTPLESMAYDYNIRGWLFGMNRSFINSTNPTNFFGFELGFDNPNTIVPATTYATQEYNGNVAGMVWKNGGDGAVRKYDFSYDAVNRLMAADFNQYNSAFNKTDGFDFSVSGLGYDANGNITKMQQMGWNAGTSSMIDNLIYTPVANSNRLLNVIDHSNNPNTQLGDFHYSAAYTATLPPDPPGKPATTQDYSYDVNGNLTADKNKDITGISYNFLNLPTTVSVSGHTINGTITYTYDAAGNKLRKMVNEPAAIVSGLTTSVTTTTDYADGFVYQSKQYGLGSLASSNYLGNLQFFGQEEGRGRALYGNVATPNTVTGIAFDYFLKDHLGNTRAVVTDEAETDVYPTLTFEGAGSSDVANQNAIWDNNSGQSINVLSTRISPLPTGFTTATSGTYCGSITKMQGAIGAAKLIKVMARDVISASIDYTYSSAAVDNTGASGLGTLGSSLANMILGSGQVGSLLESQAGSIALGMSTSSNVMSFFSNEVSSSGTTGPPEAYLHILLFNDQFVFDKANSVVYPVTTAGLNQKANLMTQIPVTITKSGYAYIYFSNESNTTVYFDNFNLTDNRGPLLETTDYYPFGLTMAGISSKAVKTSYSENKFRYNGKELQNQEFSDGSGLEEYDYGARFQDPQLGIWHNIDPHAEKYVNITPYGYVMNNPILCVDPSGMDVHLSGGAAIDFFRTIQSMMPHTIDTYDYLATLDMNENGGESDQNFTIKAVLPVYQAITPDIYKHIHEAQGEGYPAILTRGESQLTKPSRREALKPFPSSDMPVRPIYIPLSRDEYPFASTVEGGLGASVQWVPSWEQAIQSAQISSIYSFVTPGDRFIVLPLGSDTYPYTTGPAWTTPDNKTSPYWIKSKYNTNPNPYQYDTKPMDVTPILIPIILRALPYVLPVLAL